MALPCGALGQDLRVGTEFRVNTYTADIQTEPVMAIDADGDFVVVWQSFGQDGSSYGLFAQRFSRIGDPQGMELQLSLLTGFNQHTPSVAMAANGSFVVAWQSYDPQDPGDRIFARRFSSAGVALLGEFRVSGDAQLPEAFPAVASDAAGNFVVAWQTYGPDGDKFGVFARRFSNAGIALGSQFQVNSYTENQQRYPAMAAETNGDFVVVWDSVGQDGSYNGVFARRFSSAGTALASELQVNSFTLSFQSSASVGMDNDGDFVVAWASPQDDGFLAVMAQRFSNAGALLGSEFQVNTYTPDSQREPSVRSEADGDFVIAWHSKTQDGSGYGVFARRFSSAGTGLGGEFQVNTYTLDNQMDQALAAGPNGRFVLAWASGGGQDGSGLGVFAQRFAITIDFDIDGNGSTRALTDGLLAVRYMAGFRGAVLVSGAVDLAGCTRCDAPAIEAYLGGMAQ